MEGALMSHPDIGEAAVVGVPDPKWAERPLAIVVFKSGHQCEIEALKLFLASRYPRWMALERYIVIDEIQKPQPENSTNGCYAKSMANNDVKKLAKNVAVCLTILTKIGRSP
tara:strand:+ start:2500 stop:2835 length:336 start_codon:yes stop_codon:yes gene_type:complete